MGGDKKPGGEALVVFSSKSAALHSLHWEGQQIEGRYVEITISNQKEFENFKKNNWDVAIIKKIAEKEEKRLHNERQERTGRGRRKSSNENNHRGGGGGMDRSRSSRGGNNNKSSGGGGGDWDNNHRGNGGECFKCG